MFSDAPCMDYLPTLGETWPQSRGNGLVHIPYMEHLGLFFGGVCGKIMGRVTIIGRVDAYLEPT